MKAENWDKKSFTGDEIGGKTLGLIGFGTIGKETARRAIALGMKVHAYDPYVTAADSVEMVTLDELLAQADYISLHLPKTKKFANMIGAEQFSRMRMACASSTAHVAASFNEDALYEALTSGKVAGAALDVFDEEPPTDWKLLKLDNVIGSPHIGAGTKEAQRHQSAWKWRRS